MDVPLLEPPGAVAFVVYNELFHTRVMEMLRRTGIDYYTRWGPVTGKGRGTEPHLGQGAYGSTNAVLMIAFQDEAPLKALIDAIQLANAQTPRQDDHVRLFQVPLLRVV
jgi:voltage-gated potassium channel Kch